MAAHPKLTYRRETTLLAALTAGLRFEAACRAIGVSSTAVRKRMLRDADFAERVRACRERRLPEPVLDMDWRTAAMALEEMSSKRWGPVPDLPEWDD